MQDTHQLETKDNNKSIIFVSPLKEKLKDKNISRIIFNKKEGFTNERERDKDGESKVTKTSFLST